MEQLKEELKAFVVWMEPNGTLSNETMDIETYKATLLDLSLKSKKRRSR